MTEALPFAMFWLIETVVTYSVGTVAVALLAVGTVSAGRSLLGPSPHGGPLTRSRAT